MTKIKEFVEDNKPVAILSILTLIAFIIGIIICFGANDKHTNKEKKVLEENSYTMYYKEEALIKFTFRESFYKCGVSVCSDYTERVTNFELVNDQAKNLYSNVNIKNKDLDEAIGILISEAKNKNHSVQSLQLISNWKSRYNEDEFKNLLKEHLEEIPIFPIAFEYREQVDDQTIMEAIAKKTYTVTFDSNFGSLVDSQVITENELAIEPQAPTREGYDFIRWQFNSRPYNFNTPITKDITLKASWKKKPTVSTIQTTTKKTSTTKPNGGNEKPNTEDNNNPTPENPNNPDTPGQGDQTPPTEPEKPVEPTEPSNPEEGKGEENQDTNE